MSTVIIRLYIFINVHSSCQLIVGVFARQMHSTSEFAMTVLSKCVCARFFYQFNSIILSRKQKTLSFLVFRCQDPPKNN